jgi:alkanesulfonate monooxygenase SsuD/methylene tetrahydromethanopterin reductase-like flavin-dependent oxidoreductase (luciferase family)
MQIGLALPQFDFSVPGHTPLPYTDVLDCARAAEAHGFHSVWLADHVFWSVEKYGAPPHTYSSFDSIPALAGVARATERIRVGTLVLCAQLRAPAPAAKALATLDVVTGGRLDVGLGAGWYEPEFHATGIPFERPGVRLRQLVETIEVYRAMFAGGWGDAPCRPAPVQAPGPPILVGGRGDRLLDVVARHADGWNTVWTIDFEWYRGRVAVLDAACERAGREPATVRRTIGLYTLVGEDEADLRRRWERLRERTLPGVLDGTSLDDWREGHLVGTVEQVAEQLAAWAGEGVGEVVACFGALPFGPTDVDDVGLLAAAAQGLS